jgi:hypothetical protein
MTSAPTVDALAVACPHCEAEPGQRCMALCDWAKKPHARRRHLALVLAAHHDPALDGYFFYGSPTCGLCGTPGLPQRHRVVDSVAGMLAAGEDEDVIAEELDVRRQSVDVVKDWMERWPGAWR